MKIRIKQLFCFHKYKYSLESEIAPKGWCIKFWYCIYCGKQNHKKNGQELSALKNAIDVKRSFQ